MSITQYNGRNIFFCEPIKNNIMPDGSFVRIIYSTNLLTMNGIYLILPFRVLSACNYYNKYKYTFELTDEIEIIRLIEYDILDKLKSCNKKIHYNIYNQLSSGCVKITGPESTCNNPTLLLKMSGVWETDTDCGITYKFIVL